MAAPEAPRRCLFPVAGYGTRFLPVTRAMPKEMLPIIDKPLVQYGVEEALDAGMHEICFVTGRGKQAITDYFDVHEELDRHVADSPGEARLQSLREVMSRACFLFTRQGRSLGLGHAVLMGRPLIGEDAFGVALADDLCLADGDGALAQLKAAYLKHGCSVVAVQQVPEAQVERFGIVDGDDIDAATLRVSSIIEKPQPDQTSSRLGVIGRYILTSDIFDILAATEAGVGGEIQLTDALAKQAEAGRLVAVRVDARRFDCGDVDGFVAAVNHCHQKLREG